MRLVGALEFSTIKNRIKMQWQPVNLIARDQPDSIPCYVAIRETINSSQKQDLFNSICKSRTDFLFSFVIAAKNTPEQSVRSFKKKKKLALKPQHLFESCCRKNQESNTCSNASLMSRRLFYGRMCIHLECFKMTEEHLWVIAQFWWQASFLDGAPTPPPHCFLFMFKFISLLLCQGDDKAEIHKRDVKLNGSFLSAWKCICIQLNVFIL